MNLPDGDIKKQGIFTTLELIHTLKITAPTFYKYLRMTDIPYRKKHGSTAKWYSYEDYLILVNLIYPPKKIFSIMSKRYRNTDK